MPWEWRKGKNLTYLTIPEWEEQGVEIAFSNRLGGNSMGKYASLNLGLHVGDDPEMVGKNRQIWWKEFDVGWQNVVIGEQVHDNGLRWVGDTDGGSGALNLTTVLPGIDGMMTREKVGLMAFFADCMPLFFCHPETKIVAIAHAGWRGTVRKIGPRVLEELSRSGIQTGECLAAIGPGIGSCCYEVDEPVAEQFTASFATGDFLVPVSKGRYTLDLQAVNRQAILDSGVKEENIWTASLCTSCQSGQFFSHRGEGAPTGRMAGWIRRKD